MGNAGVERGFVEEMGKKAKICRNTDNVRVKCKGPGSCQPWPSVGTVTVTPAVRAYTENP